MATRFHLDGLQSGPKEGRFIRKPERNNGLFRRGRTRGRRSPPAIPNDLEQGVFWSEPASQSGLRTRSLFDMEGNVLPVISVFDNSPKRL
jgi:hypothetical protein